VVSFTTRPLYLRRNNPLYLLERRLVLPHILSRRCGGNEPTGTRTPTIRSCIQEAVVLPTELSWLLLLSHSSIKNSVKFEDITARNITLQNTSMALCSLAVEETIPSTISWTGDAICTAVVVAR
jgi:hypothetical protein